MESISQAQLPCGFLRKLAQSLFHLAQVLGFVWVLKKMVLLKSLQGGAPVRERSVGAHNSNFSMVFVGDISIVFMGL
jgi:hypothetical protein